MSPRVHEYRERLYSNIYDSLPMLEMRAGDRLFGSRNIGDYTLTNAQIPGRMPYDQTMVICNVYVRSNVCRSPISAEARSVVRDAFIEGRDDVAITTLVNEYRFERSSLVRAFDEWAHACVLDVIIGDRRMFTMNVYDLLGGPAFGPAANDTAPDAQPATPPDDETPSPQPWRRQIGLPLIVPVRQNFSVQLSRAPSEALISELEKREIYPRPLLWVHLEGLGTRTAQ